MTTPRTFLGVLDAVDAGTMTRGAANKWLAKAGKPPLSARTISAKAKTTKRKVAPAEPKRPIAKVKTKKTKALADHAGGPARALAALGFEGKREGQVRAAHALAKHEARETSPFGKDGKPTLSSLLEVPSNIKSQRAFIDACKARANAGAR